MQGAVGGARCFWRAGGAFDAHVGEFARHQLHSRHIIERSHAGSFARLALLGLPLRCLLGVPLSLLSQKKLVPPLGEPHAQIVLDERSRALLQLELLELLAEDRRDLRGIELGELLESRRGAEPEEHALRPKVVVGLADAAHFADNLAELRRRQSLDLLWHHLLVAAVDGVVGDTRGVTLLDQPHRIESAAEPQLGDDRNALKLARGEAIIRLDAADEVCGRRVELGHKLREGFQKLGTHGAKARCRFSRTPWRR